MRTEARVGRPFSIPREIAEICNGAILRTPEGEVVIEGESAKALDVTWQDSQPGQIQLVLDIDGSTVREAARKAKVDLEAVEVVALAAVPMLRHTEVIWRERLSRLDGEVVVDVVQGGSSTFREMLEANCPITLTAYVVLADGVPKEGRNAHRVGTWLSRGKFSFGKVTRGLSFALSALTEDHYQYPDVSLKRKRKPSSPRFYPTHTPHIDASSERHQAAQPENPPSTVLQHVSEQHLRTRGA